MKIMRVLKNFKKYIENNNDNNAGTVIIIITTDNNNNDNYNNNKFITVYPKHMALHLKYANYKIIMAIYKCT